PGDFEAWAKFEQAQEHDAVLLGRRTDAWFAQRWNDRSDDWAARLNGLPKYVVSSSVTEAAWHNGTVLRGNVVDEVTRLKEEVDGQIVVFGSRTLVETLLEHGLVDELQLIVFGTLVGNGGRLLERGAPQSLRLTGSERLGDNLLAVSYDVVAE
ncbi:MAG: deaminase/reductase, partial [Marmoricola sp.]|nr:deaminase/reductase [Marmoricola sp.]